MYTAYVCKIKNIRAHPNANKLLLGECFGNTVCVPLDYTENMLVIYFPTDGQLSEEFCAQHDLVRRKDENGNPAGGYMDPDKRNVKAIRLRGEKSDGLAMPIDCVAYTGVDMNLLTEGTMITILNGHEICRKYIPQTNHRNQSTREGNHTRKKRAPIAPLFAEHADAEQLAYNLSAFKPGDEIEITLKMHGTSGRTARLPVLKGYHRTLLDRIFRREGTPIYEDGYVSGIRRVVLENYEGGFYGDNSFREQHSKIFEGKLQKGEAVYYEIVGFTDTGASIMGDGNNKKLGDEFVKQYGPRTIFSYGCSPDGKKTMCGRDDDGYYEIVSDHPKSDIYVYRMTITNEDGFVVEYTPDFMRYRCEQMGVKCVPVFWKGIIEGKRIERDEITPGDWIKNIAEGFYSGPDPVGKTHTREGVVVRIVNRPKFTAYKHKNFEFKVLEGIIKDTAAAPDMEEAQELNDGES